MLCCSFHILSCIPTSRAHRSQRLIELSVPYVCLNLLGFGGHFTCARDIVTLMVDQCLLIFSFKLEKNQAFSLPVSILLLSTYCKNRLSTVFDKDVSEGLTRFRAHQSIYFRSEQLLSTFLRWPFPLYDSLCNGKKHE